MQKKYYSELDTIPIYNFNKCLEGDYRFICVEVNDKWSIDDFNAFQVIYEKFTQKYQKKELESKITLYKSLIELQCMYLETLDDYFLTQIEIKKGYIPTATEQPKIDITRNLVVLSTYTRYRLDPREVTVDEYYIIIENYERANKKK